MPPLANVFLFIGLQKTIVFFWNEFGYVKKHKLFNAVFTTVHRVKPARPNERILLTSTLLMGALQSDAGKAG